MLPTFPTVEERNADRQALLNTSYLHILKQGEPSVANGSCAYRGTEGRSCAAAPFIEEYDPKMENLNFSAMLDRMSAGIFTGKLNAVAVRERDFVMSLQRAHDGAAIDFQHDPKVTVIQEPKRYVGELFMARYLRNIINVAANFGLKLPRSQPGV